MSRLRGGMLLACLAAGCAGPPPPETDVGGSRAVADPADTTGSADTLPRPGGEAAPGRPAAPYPRGGFIDRDDVTLRMAGAGLIVDILPMNAEIVSLATDDLRTYFQEALKKVPDTVPPDLQREGTFFLIGFSSTQKEVSFEPTRVQVDSEGRRYYPRYIVPVSSGFDHKVLELFRPVWAVYIYDPGIDLLSTLEFGYGDELSTGGDWRGIVQNVEEARARAER